MSNSIRQQLSAAVNQSTGLIGDPVVYQPRGGNPLPVRAVVDGMAYLAPITGGVTLSHEERVFLIRTADLMVDGRIYVPRPDDTITVTDDSSNTHVYRVLVKDDHQYCWEWVDHHEIRRRIFTKLTDKFDV